MNDWIDFREVRKGLSFEAVLRHYGVTVKLKPGNRHVGSCPLPNHRGKRQTPSFSAKLDHGVFQCFQCRASGTVLHFATAMEGLDPRDPKNLRTVALKLRDVFRLNGEGDHGKRAAGAAARKASDRPQSGSALPVVVNPPLDFELKDLDYAHPYLKSRGFHPETIRQFGLGYCGRGLMTGRIAIPLHDNDGRLIGYAGRLVDDGAINEENPKYLLPGARERAGTRIEFRKSLFLYNGWRIRTPVTDVIVVQSFPAVWWLTQWGYASTVAVMGSDCSPEQAKLIVGAVAPDGHVWVFTDADGNGAKCAARVLTQAGLHRFVRWVRPAQGQPTDCTPGDLERLLPASLRASRPSDALADGVVQR